nr:hypothetical protein [Tanacetum cinerariifolium]
MVRPKRSPTGPWFIFIFFLYKYPSPLKVKGVDDELSDKELKQIEADDQAIQTILVGLPEDIYAAVDSCETAQEIWLRVQQMMKGSDIGIQEKKAKLFNERERQMQMIGGNGGNQFRHYAGQNVGNPAGYNDVIRNQVIQTAVQNPRVQNVRNQNGLIGVQGNGNQNQIGNGHYARNYTVRPRRRDAAYLQTQLLIAQKEEAGIQLQAEEYDLMAAAADLDEIKEVNANCILMANLQQASTLGTQTDSTPVYDTDGSAEVHENCDDNEMFNMFTQEEQYTELLEPILELHQVPQTDNEVISEDTSMEQGGETEAAKFVGDFKSLANEADASLAKHMALKLEIERLLKAVVSQDIMIIVQNESVVDTSDLQTELEHTKECFENYTQNSLSQKLENKNVELEFQVLNYARENAQLKATYKNLFDFISVLRAQTKTIIASLENELQSNIYKNAKLRTQLFKKVSDQENNTQDMSKNTKFAKQPIVENLPKIGKTNALSNSVTSNSVSTPQESKGVNNDKVIAPGMFRINPDKTSRQHQDQKTTT